MPRFPVHPDIARAETISKAVYLDEPILNESRELVFGRSWHWVGDANSVTEQGSQFPFTLLNGFLPEPLLLTRDQEDRMHCLSNVCTHRGNLLVDQSCHGHHIACRYHGRRFGLDGRFAFMPEFREVENFPTERDHLASLPLSAWGKWLFTSLDPVAGFDMFFGDMIRRMHWFPMDQLVFRPDLSRDYPVAAHWALYCENYLEGFHIPFVHAGLNAAIDYGTYTTELFRYSNLQLGLAKEGELAFDLPASGSDYGKRVGGYYFWVFPNMMFNFYPWGVSINIVKPIGIDASVISFLTYVCDETKLERGAGSDLFTVEMEDEAVVEAVQQGIRSRHYTHGRYSVTRETGTHHFHRLLSEFLG